MERLPEADLMDNVEQARAYSETDFSEAHDSFVTHFKSRFPDFSGQEVLDLGCGTADVVIRFAHAFNHLHIMGIDGAQAMLDIGVHDVKKAGLSERVTLIKCLLPDETLSSRQFDGIISNSLLHHLQDPMTIWNTARQCSKQGAPIFIMDLLRPENPAKARELVTLHATNASPILQRDFYNSLLASYHIDEIREQLYSAGLAYLRSEIISDRHLLVWGAKNG